MGTMTHWPVIYGNSEILVLTVITHLIWKVLIFKQKISHAYEYNSPRSIGTNFFINELKSQNSQYNNLKLNEKTKIKNKKIKTK